MSFGMLGCDLHCNYCQNWITSQTGRDPGAIAPVRVVSPAEIVRLAIRSGARAVISTYNEPLITAEWAVAMFKAARVAGLMTGVVSNGNATAEVLRYLRPWTDLYKVDLKCFDDRQYRALGGRLKPVLDSIRSIHDMGFWLEVVTLVGPGFNDSDTELGNIAGFLADVSADVPWHVTAFHADYKLTDCEATPAETLRRAAALGRAAGVRDVFAGNNSGLNYLENNACSKCGELLVVRSGFRVLSSHVTEGGTCPRCGENVAGRWFTPAAAGVAGG
jgi:pyruvate formate lyase activating enzyme